MNFRRTALKHLAIASVLAFSAQAALACDDADEEMKMAAAYEVATVARAEAQQAASPRQDAAAQAHADPTPVAAPVQTADAAQR